MRRRRAPATLPFVARAVVVAKVAREDETRRTAHIYDFREGRSLVPDCDRILVRQKEDIP